MEKQQKTPDQSPIFEDTQLRLLRLAAANQDTTVTRFLKKHGLVAAAEEMRGFSPPEFPSDIPTAAKTRKNCARRGVKMSGQKPPFGLNGQEKPVTKEKKKVVAVEAKEAVPIITQGELRQYVEQARELQRLHRVSRESLIERLEQGAKIEPGELTAKIEIESRKRWTWRNIEAVLGWGETSKLWRQFLPTPIRHLLVLDSQGNDHAWKEWRLKNDNCPIDAEPSPASAASPLPRLLRLPG